MKFNPAAPSGPGAPEKELMTDDQLAELLQPLPAAHARLIRAWLSEQGPTPLETAVLRDRKVDRIISVINTRMQDH